MKNILKEKGIYIIILIIVASIVCVPLLSSNLNVYQDDGIQHIARAYGTYESMKSGVLFGNVISSFANGYGYSWNLFYGAFTTFGIIFFRIITGSYIVRLQNFCLCVHDFVWNFYVQICKQYV